jgi:photosystem II stability/assembly factor-like uncharacterized protein
MKKLFTIQFVLLMLFANAQPSSFSARGVGGGGALFALSINPANNSEYYVSCDMGELFHTNNFGNSYDQVHFQQLIGGHNSKVCYTSSAGLLYSVNYANNQVVPVKSTNNGATWSTLTGNPDNTEETFSIDVDYNNPNRVIISYYSNIYFSANGGAGFTSIHTATSNAGNVVGGVFFDGNNIFIGTNDGVLVSANGGLSWTVSNLSGIPATERIWSFAGGKAGGVTRFFCITATTSDIYAGVVGSDYYNFAKGVYSSDFGSGSWTAKMTGINTATDFPMFVGMANNDINTVYLAGSNSTSYPDIIKTSSAGTSWTHAFKTALNQNISTGWSGQGGDRGWGYGECAFGIAVAPNNSGTVIFGDYGFVHKTSDGGSNWQQAYVNSSGQNPAAANTPPNKAYQSCGLENTTCWQVHWTSATNLWACFSDIRGIKSNDSGNSWSYNYTGNTANSSYRIVQHPNNGTLYAATSGVHDMYQSTRLQDAQLDANDVSGKIIYSTDGGTAWQDLKVFNHPVFWIALDPNNPNRAYASVIHYSGGSGVGGIYTTDNLQNLSSSTWTLLPAPPRTEKHPAAIVVLNDGKVVCTYSGRRTPAGAFTASSGVFIFNPSANAWTDVSHSGMNYWTKDVMVDPNDPAQNTWYAGVFSGWGGPPNGLGGLYKTTNRGATWTRLTNAATIDRVTSVTFNPADQNQIYMTTETNGLWMSNNINSTTPVFTLVQNYPFQQPERVFFNPYNTNEMWVTSFGNGLKVGMLNTVTGKHEFPERRAGISIFPNPSQGSTKVNVNFDASETVNAEIFELSGKKVMEKTALVSYKYFELDLSGLANGVYVIKLSSLKGTSLGNAKLIVEK